MVVCVCVWGLGHKKTVELNIQKNSDIEILVLHFIFHSLFKSCVPLQPFITERFNLYLLEGFPKTINAQMIAGRHDAQRVNL